MENFTEVFAWGLDNKGQLGLGNKATGKSISTPRFCSYNIMIKEVACGEDHSGFISDSGHVYMMGSNANGKLGIGDRSVPYSTSPYLVEGLESLISLKIVCGSNHTAVLTTNRVMFTWGLGQYGALGSSNTESSWSPLEVLQNVDDLSCGSRHTAAIINYSVFTCGSGDAGQLGTGKRQSSLVFTQIPQIKASQVSCGEFHTGLITPEGHVYTMGGNSFGQLGIGNKKSSSVPVKIDLPKASKISCGSHTACITQDGFYIWGNSVFGEFLSPKKVQVSNNRIIEVSIGGTFAVAIDSENKVFAWGNNSNGELAQGDFHSKPGVLQITYLKTKKISKISAGSNFCICLGESTANTCHIKTQSIGMSTRDLEALNNEKNSSSLELKESYQVRLQEVNKELQEVNSEAFRLKEALGEVTNQLHLVRNENGFLKEENGKLRKVVEQAGRNEGVIGKVNEEHYVELQGVMALLDKEKVLRKQVERDLEVACAHRHRLEEALEAARELGNGIEREKAGKLEGQVKDLLYEKGQLRSLNENLKSKLETLEQTLQDMYEENKFYAETTKDLHSNQKALQDLLKETEKNFSASPLSEIRNRESTIKVLSQENSELKLMLADLEKTVQDLLNEKEEKFLSMRSKGFPENPSKILAPKVPNLKGRMPQIDLIADAPLTSNRKNLADAQKERLKNAAQKLIENQKPDSPLKALRISSPSRGSPDGRPEAFTFRKSTTPSKEDIRAKIASLMQNRSRIESRLKSLQQGQEGL